MKALAATRNSRSSSHPRSARQIATVRTGPSEMKFTRQHHLDGEHPQTPLLKAFASNTADVGAFIIVDPVKLTKAMNRLLRVHIKGCENCRFKAECLRRERVIGFAVTTDEYDRKTLNTAVVAQDLKSLRIDQVSPAEHRIDPPTVILNRHEEVVYQWSVSHHGPANRMSTQTFFIIGLKKRQKG